MDQEIPQKKEITSSWSRKNTRVSSASYIKLLKCIDFNKIYHYKFTAKLITHIFLSIKFQLKTFL
jgi:hypothetical protein